MFFKMSYQVLQSPMGQPDKRWDIFAGLEKGTCYFVLKIGPNMNQF